MDFLKLHDQTLANKTVEALKKNFFDAVYFDTKEEAAEFIMKHVKPGCTVGFGGSKTIIDMGIQDKVKAANGIVLDHNDPSLTPQEKLRTQKAELTCNLFLCSTNAVTLDGELVNIDGAGNRVCAMTFGPDKAIVVAGVNKICKDEKDAFTRLEMIAAPTNVKRFNLSNPCSVTGSCMDCQAKTRICRVYSILKRKPMASDITVVIIGENAGF